MEEFEPDFDVKDEAEFDENIRNALGTLEGDYSESSWNVYKYDPSRDKYNRIQNIPITEELEEFGGIKQLIKTESWGGPGTYKLFLMQGSEKLDSIPNVEFYLPQQQKEIMQKVNYPHQLNEKKTKDEDFGNVVNKVISEEIQTMKLLKNRKDLYKMLNGEEPKQSSNDMFLFMMQMSKEDQRRQQERDEREQKRREEMDEKRQLAEEKRERERKEEQKEREQKEREYRMHQEQLQLERDKMNQAMVAAMTKKEESPITQVLLAKLLEPQKDDPMKTVLLQKILEEKKDPTAEMIPLAVKQIMDLQTKSFEAQLETVKKNAERERRLEESDETVKKMKAAGEYIINPIVETFGPAMAVKLQRKQDTQQPPQPQPQPHPTPQTQEPKQEEKYTHEENVLVEAAKMIGKGKTADEAWDYCESNLTKEQMDFVFIENRENVIKKAEPLAAGGFAEGQKLIDKIRSYGNVVKTS